MSRTPMYADPRHPGWVRVPLVGAALLLGVTLMAVYDLVAHGNSSAWTGIVCAPVTALGLCWVAWDIRREQRA